MNAEKSAKRPPSVPSGFEQARDELFSHILRCGVLEATVEHQKDWFDDTMDYLADRYHDLSDAELAQVRQMGERYCRPVRRPDESDTVAAAAE